MQEAYDDDRPTVVLPGTDGTITGVAINEWLDDDGNPKFGKDKQQDPDENDRSSGLTETRFRFGEAPRPSGKSRKTRWLRSLSCRRRFGGRRR